MEDLSPVLAQRLKDLRESRGFSLAGLSKALTEKYGIQISKESLTNYEVVDSFHSKARKNEGMSVKYLRCLADFYGVSTDYLLGLSDIKSPDNLTRVACNSVGLNEHSIEILSKSKQLSLKHVQRVIDRLLSDEYYKNVEKTREYKTIIRLLDFFFEYQGKFSTMVVTQDGSFYENKYTDWSNEIRLDCQMVENAVLLEINRALINLKAHLKEEDHNNGQHHKSN